MWVEFRVVEFGGDIKKKDMNSCIYYALVISFYIIECYFLTYTTFLFNIIFKLQKSIKTKKV